MESRTVAVRGVRAVKSNSQRSNYHRNHRGLTPFQRAIRNALYKKETIPQVLFTLALDLLARLTLICVMSGALAFGLSFLYCAILFIFHYIV